MLLPASTVTSVLLVVLWCSHRSSVWSGFGSAGFNVLNCCFSTLEPADATSESALHVFPHPFDYPRIVVEVREVVIEGREAVLLTSLLHMGCSRSNVKSLILPQSKRQDTLEKHVATVPSFRMITLFCPVLPFHSARPRSPLSPCTMPAVFLMHACFQTCNSDERS